MWECKNSEIGKNSYHIILKRLVRSIIISIIVLPVKGGVPISTPVMTGIIIIITSRGHYHII